MHVNRTALVVWRIEQLIHEILNIVRRNPRRAEPDVDLRCLQVFGLGGSERRHVGLEGSVRLRCQLCFAQLLTYIARKVFIGSQIFRLIFRRTGDAVDHAGEFFGKLFFVLACQPRHKGEIDLCPLPDGHSQRVGSCVRMVDTVSLPDRPLGKHVRLAFEAMLLIQNLKRTEQIIRGIVRKGQAVGAVVDEAIFC